MGLLSVVAFANGYGFYFVITWLPTFLGTLGFSAAPLAVYAGLPMIFAVPADLLGGVMTDWLARKLGLLLGRALVGGAAYAVAATAMFAATRATDHPHAAAVLLAVAGGASMFALAASSAACIEISSEHSGLVSATMNTMGQVGGMLSPIVLAWLLERFGAAGKWLLPLQLIGSVYAAAALCWLFINPRRQLSGTPHPHSFFGPSASCNEFFLLMKISRLFFHSGLLASMLVSVVGAAQGPTLNPDPADLSALGRRQPGTMATAPIPDARHIKNGWSIPSKGYADQPYIVPTDDGAWLCVITTGTGHEGSPGQHVVSMRSTDLGRSWETMVPIEPADGPEASYAVMLKVSGGRVYVFYNHNTDRVKEVKYETKGATKRVDSLGYYVFKYSDDHGRTWSTKRHVVPVREFAADRNNIYGGKLRFFWNVGRPLILGDAAILVLHKVGAMGSPGFFAQSEGAFLKSKNILTERDPEKIIFETLPDGDVGLRTPTGGGRIAEEQSIVSLSDGSLYCVYRTVDGWPANAYSRDAGHTWTSAAYMTYAPGGPRVKHPRAANFVWKCGNGKFLYWFHNHGGAIIGKMAADATGATGNPYNDRNPAWLMAGTERDTPNGKVIEWSQPEIFLYDDDPYIRMSYPDLVEQGGKFYITETQKNVGRIHEVPAQLVEGLFKQSENRTVAREGVILDLPAGRTSASTAIMPKLPDFNGRDAKRPDYGAADLRTGFSLDLWFKLESVAAGQVLLDSRDARGRGLVLTTTADGAVRITLNDGGAESSWASDAKTVLPGQLRHLVVTVDGGPKIITFVVDGVLCDGGEERQFGWGRFSPHLRAPNGAEQMKRAPGVGSLRIYRRALRTSEAVGNFRAGL